MKHRPPYLKRSRSAIYYFVWANEFGSKEKHGVAILNRPVLMIDAHCVCCV